MKIYLHLLACLTFALLCCQRANAIDFKQIGKQTVLFSYHSTESDIPANGVIIFGIKRAVVINPPSTGADVDAVFDWVEKYNRYVEYVVPQHWHYDSSGGLPKALQRGARIIMLNTTQSMLQQQAKTYPAILFESRYRLRTDGLDIEIAFPGAGHSSDNVVVWIPHDGILFGGDLIRPLNAKDLGHTIDANIKAWPKTLNNIKRDYSKAETVVPGHGTPGGLTLIDHTLELLNANP